MLQQTPGVFVVFPVAEVVDDSEHALPSCSTAFQDVTLRLWRLWYLEQIGQCALR